MSYVEIAGFGTSESRWQDWPGLAEIPTVTLGELFPEHCRVVVVAPHPDDEILGVGGMLAQLTERHHEILLLAATDGTASHPGSATWTPAKLGAARPRETVEALRIQGVDAELLRLGLPDGAVADLEEMLTRHLTEMVQAADIVLATWQKDAHPDHEAVGRAAAAACAATGATLFELPIWMWHWAAPGDTRVPWERAVRVPMSAEIAARKAAAVRAFVSQVAPDPALEIGAVLPPPHLERLLRSFEVVFR